MNSFNQELDKFVVIAAVLLICIMVFVLLAAFFIST